MAEEPSELSRSANLTGESKARTLGADEAAPEEMRPCIRCEWPLPARLMGCRGGRCPNCGHNYPHGDCSD